MVSIYTLSVWVSSSCPLRHSWLRDLVCMITWQKTLKERTNPGGQLGKSALISCSTRISSYHWWLPRHSKWGLRGAYARLYVTYIGSDTLGSDNDQGQRPQHNLVIMECNLGISQLMSERKRKVLYCTSILVKFGTEFLYQIA